MVKVASKSQIQSALKNSGIGVKKADIQTKTKPLAKKEKFFSTSADGLVCEFCGKDGFVTMGNFYGHKGNCPKNPKRTKVSCPDCGKVVINWNLDYHRDSANCIKARGGLQAVNNGKEEFNKIQWQPMSATNAFISLSGMIEEMKNHLMHSDVTLAEFSAWEELTEELWNKASR